MTDRPSPAPASSWLAPLDCPDLYPGGCPKHSFLLLNDFVYPLTEEVGRRLGYSRVHDISSLPGNWQFLDQLLYHRGAAPMDSRIPVLAYGSNANPSQLMRKFDGFVSTTVPVTAVRTKGIQAVFFAKCSYYGAVPLTLTRAETNSPTADFHVTWLDPDQFLRMTTTEPGYRIYTLSADSPEPRWVEFRNEEANLKITTFVAEEPILLSNGKPLVSCSLREPEAMREVQSKAHQALKKLDRTEFIPLQNQWVPAPSFPKTLPPRYRELVDTTIRSATPDEHLRVIASTQAALANGRPNGHPVLYLPRQHTLVRGPLRRARIAKIQALSCGCSGTADSPPVLSASIVRDSSEVLGLDEVGIDITIRFALGLALNERVLVQRQNTRILPSDWLLPTSRIIGRVVTSDGRVVERKRVLVESLTLAQLGIEEGDPVWISSTSRDGKMHRIRAEAFVIPAELAAFRDGVAWPDRLALFPDCGRLFGGETDLPSIYLDAEDRDRLGVSKCDPITISAVRLPQFAKAFRELALLLLVAALGIATIWEGRAGWVMVAAASAAAVLTYLSVRQRLK